MLGHMTVEAPPAEKSRVLKRALNITGAVLMAVVTIGSIIAFDRASALSRGPLGPMGAHGWIVDAEPGEIIVDGSEVLKTTSGTATITGIDIDVEGDAIELVGVSAAGAGREYGAYQQVKSWPVTEPGIGEVFPAVGATFDSGDWGTELFIAMKVTQPGHHLRKGYWVSYEVDGHPYRDYVQAELTFCSTPELIDGECEFLGEGAE